MSKNELTAPSDTTCSPNPSCPELDQTLTLSNTRFHYNIPRNIDFKLLEHPIFNHEQDDLLSSLLALIKPLIQNTANFDHHFPDGWEWLEQLFEAVFLKSNLREIRQDFKNLPAKYSPLCGKLIQGNEIFFRCIDCEKKPQDFTALFCTDCFEKSSHKNHRVLMLKNEANISLSCSCGCVEDASSCPKHSNQNIALTQDQILDQLPEGFLQRFLDVLQKGFYSVFVLFEVSEKAQNPLNKEAILSLGQLAMEELLLFCTICYSEINEALLLAITLLLQSKLPHGYNLLGHHCHGNNGTIHNIKGLESFETAKCQCSILSLMFKYPKKLNEELQMKLHKILIEASNKNLSFKSFLAQEFSMNLNFFFNNHGHIEDFHHDHNTSTLLKLRSQLFSSQNLHQSLINSGAFQNLLNTFKTIVQNSSQISFQILSSLEILTSTISSFLQSNSLEILQTTSLLEDLLNIAQNLQCKSVYKGHIAIGTHAHQVDYGFIDCSLKLENLILQVLELSFIGLSRSPEDIKNTFYVRFLRVWRSVFEAYRKENNEYLSFNISLERCLVTAFFYYSEDLSKLKELLAQAAWEEENKVILHVIQGVSRRLGMTRYLHLTHDFTSATGLEGYYGHQSRCFEYDIVGLQVLSSLTTENLFENIVKGFFDYDEELQEFLLSGKNLPTNDHLRAKLTMLEDFLTLLVYLMNDQICLVNLQKNSQDFKTLEKVIKNTLVGKYWTDMTSLKIVLSQVLKDTTQIDAIIEKLVIVDHKLKKIRIKDEYKHDIDPYLFYKMPSLQKEITIAFASKDSKSDLVSGNMEEMNVQISKALFNNGSSLANFLTYFVQNLNKDLACVTRPMLKLLLTHVQLGSKDTQVYLTPNFIEKLAAVSSSQDLTDCEPCVTKIQGLLKDLANQTGQGHLFVPSHEEAHHNDNEKPNTESKKDLMNKRMQKLKEDFMNKQKLFMNKNSHLIHENAVSDAKTQHHNEDENTLTCQHCLEKLDNDKEGYGIPIYINLTNNFYDLETPNHRFKSDENPEKLSQDWWPVISSCGHYYHQKCFKALHANSRAASELPVNYFNHKFETCCSLCKTLCNCFLPLGDSQEEKSSETDQQYPHLSLDFASKIEGVIHEIQRKLSKNPNNTVQGISAEEVFNRSYTYFLESFNGNYDSPKTQKRAYEIYEGFLKAATKSFKPSDSQKASFLESVCNENGTNPMLLLQYRPEGLLNRIMYNNLRKHNKNEKTFIEGQKELLEEYVMFKTIQTLAIQQEPNVLEKWLVPIQKILLGTYLNKRVLFNTANPAVLEVLACKDTELNLERINKAVQGLFNEDLSIENIVKNAINSKTQEIFNMMAAQEEGLVLPKISRFGPKMVRLPETYAEFNSIYIKKKCSRCNQFSKNLSTSLCLICGKVICQSCCHTSNSDRDFGNLNKHAKKYHLGQSLFIEIQRLTKTIISSPVNSVYPGENIYVDEFGQAVQFMLRNDKESIYKVDFGRFTLNENFREYVGNLVNGHGIAREAFMVSKVYGYYYNDNIL